MTIKTVTMLKGVHEYCEGYSVEEITYENGRRTIRVTDGGFDMVENDLTELLNALGIQ